MLGAAAPTLRAAFGWLSRSTRLGAFVSRFPAEPGTRMEEWRAAPELETQTRPEVAFHRFDLFANGAMTTRAHARA